MLKSPESSALLYLKSLMLGLDPGKQGFDHPYTERQSSKIIHHKD